MTDPSSIADALREVWLRHRDGVLVDLASLIELVTESDAMSQDFERADEIGVRAHRIAGSLSLVGRREGAEILHELESGTVTHSNGAVYGEEVVERLHDLLERLRTID